MNPNYAVGRLILQIPLEAFKRAQEITLFGKPWKTIAWKEYFPFLVVGINASKLKVDSFRGAYDGISWFAQRARIEEYGGFVILSAHPWDSEVRSAFVRDDQLQIPELLQMNKPRRPASPIEESLSKQQAERNKSVAIFALGERKRKTHLKIESLTLALRKAHEELLKIA